MDKQPTKLSTLRIADISPPDPLSETMFGLGEVATILGTPELPVPEWRVKNFVQGPTFGIRPSQHAGSRKRRLKLFNGVTVVRLGIALELTYCGFAPAAIGEVMTLLDDQDIKRGLDSEQDIPPTEHMALVRVRDKWEISRMHDVDKRFKDLKRNVKGVYVLPITALSLKVKDAIEELIYSYLREMDAAPSVEEA